MDTCKNSNAEIEMSKDNWVESLFKGMAIIGGGWLILELMKALANKKTYYQCPNCGYYKIEEGFTKCPSCETKLSWDNA